MPSNGKNTGKQHIESLHKYYLRYPDELYKDVAIVAIDADDITFSSGLFEDLPQRLVARLPAQTPDTEVQSTVRRNVFLCVKESLNNILKYAEASEVVLSISLQSGTTEIIPKVL